MVLNIIVTFGVLAVVLAVMVAATVPDVAVGPTLTVMGLIAVILPMVVYPFTYTLWLAIDLAAHPPSPAELAVADAHRASPDPEKSSARSA